MITANDKQTQEAAAIVLDAMRQIKKSMDEIPFVKQKKRVRGGHCKAGKRS